MYTLFKRTPLAIALLCLTACNPNVELNKAASATNAALQAAAASTIGATDASEITPEMLADIENTLINEAKRSAAEAGLSEADTQDLITQAKKIARELNKAKALTEQTQNDGSFDEVGELLAVEYRAIGINAQQTNKSYLDPQSKKIFEMLRKNAPELNIQAVSFSQLLPKNFVQVMVIDNATNQPHFVVYSLTGNYFVFPELSWGSSFFDKKGQQIKTNEERAAIVKDLASALAKIQSEVRAQNGNKPTAGNFYDVSANYQPKNKNLFLISDLDCTHCASAEALAAKYATPNATTASAANDIANIKANSAIVFVSNTRPFNKPLVADSDTSNKDIGDMNRATLLYSTNCNTSQNLKLSYTPTSDKLGVTRHWELSNNTLNDKVPQGGCAKPSYMTRALILSFGIKPSDLPLLINEDGLQVSGKITEEDYLAMLRETAK